FAEVRGRVGGDAIVLEQRVEAHRRREAHQRVGDDLFLTDGRQHVLDLDDALGRGEHPLDAATGQIVFGPVIQQQIRPTETEALFELLQPVVVAQLILDAEGLAGRDERLHRQVPGCPQVLWLEEQHAQHALYARRVPRAKILFLRRGNDPARFADEDEIKVQTAVAGEVQVADAFLPANSG